MKERLRYVKLKVLKWINWLIEMFIRKKSHMLCFHNYSHRVIDQLEHKISTLKEELVGTKEALNRALLDKEVLDQQKSEVSK